MTYVLSIDQGTSGSKAIIFAETGEIVSRATVSLESHFFNDGFVEQNPDDIVSTVLTAVRQAVGDFVTGGHRKDEIIAAAISNQRESFLLWDAAGRPLTNVVVWQCKRSVGICARMKQAGLEPEIQDKSGLLVDPYFSGTKVAWLLENDSELKVKCDRGEVFFGNIDAWLLYRLTDGKQYKTDYTNAARTLFFNLDTLSWDAGLLALLGAEHLRLPEIACSSSDFGSSTFGGLFPAGLPISAMIGDSHSASFGEGCLSPGTVKATMGTGSSVLMNTGAKRVRSAHGMVSTICWSAKGRVDYALEGVIVSCGSTVNWVQNQLGLVADGKEFDRLAESVGDAGNVTFLPAFSGLGGPHWQMNRKAEITGISFDTTAAHIVRAALESYPFQLKDVIGAMEGDMGTHLAWLKADGGLTASRLTMQYIADLLDTEVIIDKRKEASAFGTALLAFIYHGILSMDDIVALFASGERASYRPAPDGDSYIKKNYERWLEVVNRR
jgi:glycerol kinase